MRNVIASRMVAVSRRDLSPEVCLCENGLAFRCMSVCLCWVPREAPPYMLARPDASREDPRRKDQQPHGTLRHGGTPWPGKNTSQGPLRHGRTPWPGKTVSQSPLRHGGTPAARKNCLSPSLFFGGGVVVMVGSCAENKSRASRGNHGSS